jgi:ABC-type lipoprotein release transport system permease subunit
VSPGDAPTFALASAALVGVAVVACWLPASKAVRIDPVATLRAD